VWNNLHITADIIFRNGQLVENADEDNESEDKLFERYERRYKELKEGKKKLISKLLLCMDKEIKDSLMTSPGY
jgi:hypothetical protein